MSQARIEAYARGASVARSRRMGGPAWSITAVVTTTAAEASAALRNSIREPLPLVRGEPIVTVGKRPQSYALCSFGLRRWPLTGGEEVDVYREEA